MSINDVLKKYKDITEARLADIFEECKAPKLSREAMEYSVKAGGKRIRPAMHLMSASLFSDNLEQNIDIACALEMIHTYSLIHDDLPALDNDVLRRGKPTNHVLFGEAQAILAGDGLLTFAFETMMDNALKYSSNAVNHIKAINTISHRAGIGGMVAGQVMDIECEGKAPEFENLKYIHTHKTGDMIVAALLSGAQIHTENRTELDAIISYGEDVGLIFQIVDDCLDITANEDLGKSRGKDAASGKLTYPAIFGLEKSLQIAKETNDHAKDVLGIFGSRKQDLCDLADMMLNRKK